MIARWENLTWEELEKKIDIATAVIITGAVEQHGHHLPLGTDVMIPRGLVDRLGNKFKGTPEVDNLILLPPLYYTPARHSNWLVGTVNLSGMSLINNINDILTDLFRQGIKKVLCFNGHMESAAFVSEGISLAAEKQKKCKVVMVNWWELVSEALLEDIFGDDWPGWVAEHAALTETSLMLSLAPELVNMDKALFTDDYKHYPYEVIPQPEEVRPSTGAYAAMSSASADLGNQIVEHIIDHLRITLREQFL